MTSLCLRSPGKLLELLNKSIRSMLLPSARPKNSKIHTNSTIDADELKHLSKLAASWWDPAGPVKQLHVYNLLRVPLIRDSLVTLTPDTPQSTCLQGKKILDVGCGPGILTEDLAKLGANVTGIDPSKEMVQAAIEHSKFNTNLLNKPTYINTTIEEHIKQHSNVYDAVVSCDVLEHIKIGTRELFIESCVKALKPGGKIIITTPNRTRMAQLLGIFLLEGLNIIPRGTHHYHKFITPDELKYWMELNDCRVDLFEGYAYYFWANTFQWINWKSLMYAMRAVKLN